MTGQAFRSAGQVAKKWQAATGNDTFPPEPAQAQIKNIVLASLGSVLEWYEFQVFGFLTVIIARLFFPPTVPQPVRVFQTLAIFSLGYVLRPIAGAVIGYFGDRYGRKKLFLLTVFGMAASTMLIGLLPTYAQIGVAAPIILLLLRMVQGIAIAGEFAGAAVFVMEHVRRERVGSALGPMVAGTYFGWFLGAMVGTLLVTFMQPEAFESWGWRSAFIAGGLVGLLAVWLRRALDETPRFQKIAGAAAAAKMPMLALFRDHSRSVLIVAGAGIYVGTAALMVYFFTPTLLQSEYHVPRKAVFTAVSAALLMLAFACVVWGRIADRIGPSLVLGIGACGIAVVMTLFFLNIAAIAAHPAQLLWWYMMFSVALGTLVAVPIIGTLAFSTDVRFSGFGLSYNIGSVIAAVTPTLLAWLVIRFGSSSVSYFALAVALYGLLISYLAKNVLRADVLPRSHEQGA